MAGGFSKLFSSWMNVTSQFRNDLVFADRNQEYGAYQLRKKYNRSYSFALLITVVAFILGFGIPKVVSVFTAEPEIVENVDVQVDLDPPPIDENEPEPEPPPPPPPPPLEEMFKFVPPVVVDEIITDSVLSQAVVVNLNVGSRDQAGVDSIIDFNPDDIGNGPADEPKKEEIFNAVQEMPQFIPGDPAKSEAAMMKFIYENIVYPQTAKDNNVEGKIRIKFTVKPDGTIKNAHVISKDKLGFGCEEEAIRVIESMPPWKPGRQNGNPVSVYFNLPITYKLF